MTAGLVFSRWRWIYFGCPSACPSHDAPPYFTCSSFKPPDVMRPIRALKGFQRPHFSQWKPNCDGFHCVFSISECSSHPLWHVSVQARAGRCTWDWEPLGEVEHRRSVGWERLYFSPRRQTKHFLPSASKIWNVFRLLSPCSAVNQSRFLNPAWRCLNKEKSPSQFGCVHSLHPPSVFHSFLFLRASTHCHTDTYISFFWDLRVVSACTGGRVHVCVHQAVLVGTDPLR